MNPSLPTLAALLLVPLAVIQAADNKPAKPNIVYILADDLGYGDVGCYNAQSKIPTPNLDRLAREGIRFTDAHAPDAVCTPTRYGLLTGRYCFRSRMKSGVLPPWGEPLIEEGRLTVPALLRQHGYATMGIGKWHLGWAWPTQGRPARCRARTDWATSTSPSRSARARRRAASTPGSAWTCRIIRLTASSRTTTPWACPRWPRPCRKAASIGRARCCRAGASRTSCRRSRGMPCATSRIRPRPRRPSRSFSTSR